LEIIKYPSLIFLRSRSKAVRKFEEFEQNNKNDQHLLAKLAKKTIGELIVHDSLPIPPNTQNNFPGRQSRLGHRLCRITAFRSRPLAPYVVESYPLFIACHHTLQKRVDFVAI